MVVKGTIQSGPLVEHTSYWGGDKGRPCDRNQVTGWMVGKQELIFSYSRMGERKSFLFPPRIIGRSIGS